MLGCPANLTEGPLRDVRFLLIDILCLPYSSLALKGVKYWRWRSYHPIMFNNAHHVSGDKTKAKCKLMGFPLCH